MLTSALFTLGASLPSLGRPCAGHLCAGRAGALARAPALTAVLSGRTLAAAPPALSRRQLSGADALGGNGNATWPINRPPAEEEVPANCTTACAPWQAATRAGSCAQTDDSLGPCGAWTMRNEDLCAALGAQASCLLCAFPELNSTSAEYQASYGGTVGACADKGFQVVSSGNGKRAS